MTLQPAVLPSQGTMRPFFYFYFKKRRKEILMWETSISCLAYVPDQGLNLQPRHVPWPGLKQVTFCSVVQHPTNWANPVRTEANFVFHYVGEAKTPIIKTVPLSPGWCGSVDWAPACEPSGCQFDSQSGHMPGLLARSPAGGLWEGTDRCFSPSF